MGPVALILGIAFGLAGCAVGPAIDTRHTALGQDSRVQFVIVHYTDADFASSLRILTQQQVSSHYLIGDGSVPRIHRLVDESRRAWHAGDSAWGPHAQLNASSIGIELVNAGGKPGDDGQLRFAPYPDAQIDALIGLLKDIVARHRIAPTRILGHSDVAPQRKVDPGPAFPWHRLAQAGLIAWPDARHVAAKRALYDARLPDAAWFQRELALLGFRVPSHGMLDEPTRRVIAAFQMKYRPSRFDGEPDAETAALLDAVNAAGR